MALTDSATLLYLQDNAGQIPAQADASAIAYNLLIYRNALAEYAHAKPTVTGAPAGAVLALPTY